MLSSLYNLVNRSHKRRAELKAIYEELHARATSTVVATLRTLKRFVPTRWLSRGQSIAAVLDRYEQLVVLVLERLGDKEDSDVPIPMTRGGKKTRMGHAELQKSIVDFKVIGLLHYLGDVAAQLNVLSQALQGPPLTTMP